MRDWIPITSMEEAKVVEAVAKAWVLWEQRCVKSVNSRSTATKAEKEEMYASAQKCMVDMGNFLLTRMMPKQVKPGVWPLLQPGTEVHRFYPELPFDETKEPANASDSGEGL